ncbi:hypothetical protein J2Z30_007253 [Streptomyces iranensis]|uniref:Tn3 transposase DDE domain-containing protein n=1 Tax=Streptomyces iranensis TaxID=576784 RepID=A0ABS4N2F6_9ACTN|nr:hypothetical protein [Streptomyces iranensis]
MDTYFDNRLAETSVRYGKPGGIAYRHISDTCITLFTRFIPCGVWEAVYVIEGLLKNSSEVEPTTVHADTQGQTLPVFTLAHLLGFDLMPRIRNWKDLAFYRPSRTTEYVHIDALVRRGWLELNRPRPDRVPSPAPDAGGHLRARGRHLLGDAAQAAAVRVAQERHVRRLPRGRPRHPHRPTPAVSDGRTAASAGDRGDQQGRVVRPPLRAQKLQARDGPYFRAGQVHPRLLTPT